MAKTLLQGVNEVLKRVNALDSDTGVLTTLTDSPRQHYIDLAIQLWNEGIDELYAHAQNPKPNMTAEDTITLETGTRDYALATDIVEMQWRLHLYNATNAHYILFLREGGWETLILNDPEEDDTGLPSRAAINPITGNLYMERTPTANENGRVYTYRYFKDLELTAATDQVPFTNACFRAMVAAVAMLWRREKNSEWDSALYMRHIGRAARFLSQTKPRTSWTSPNTGVNRTDPMEA